MNPLKLIRLANLLAWLIVFLPFATAHSKTVVVKGFDLVAIASAIKQSEPGDTVSLPAGIYEVNEAIHPKSLTRLIGAGQGKTIVRFASDKPGVIVNLSNCEDVEVAYLTLDGASNPNAHQGIFAHDARRINIHNVTIQNLVKSKAFGPHGILFTGINPTREKGVTDSIIADCIFENIGIDSKWGAAIRLAWGSSRNRVLRNVIRSTGRGGILCDNGSTDLVIQQNIISGSGLANGEGLGIEVWNGCDRAVIEDNQIDHWLSVGGSDFCAVRRNVISNKSGSYKFCGIELIGSYCVVTDNIVDDGQHIGISVSDKPPKNYVFWGYNIIRNCIQWGAQLQGDGKGIAYHYFYRCKFLNNPVGRATWYPGDEGSGFRCLAKTYFVTLEECEISGNGRYGVQLVGGNIDFLSFIRCIIKGNGKAAVFGPEKYTALEWIECIVKSNGNDDLPPAKPFQQKPPKAAFDVPSRVRVGEQVTFVSKSQAVRGDIAMVLWDFNDGVPVNKAIATHTYNRPGKYRVTLVVWDTTGRGARMEQWIKVNSAMSKN